MSWRTEFPEFLASDLPAIPSDWIDSSWHNDASPSWTTPAERLQIFISESDPAARELQSGGRFNVLSLADATLDHCLLTTDAWRAVLAMVAAKEIED